MKIKSLFIRLIPFIAGLLIAMLLYRKSGWWGFFVVFPWIGLMITLAIFISNNIKTIDLGRRIAILAISPVFLIFLGIYNRESFQIEEAVFFISAGIFARVLVHYAVAKIFGPLIFRRGFCAWGCWTAAILEWLPIKENRKIPAKYTYIRFLVLIISILIPVLFIYSGYDYKYLHIDKASGQFHAIYWFLAGNIIYYLFAIPLAFIFKKKRAFCKIMCPVSIVMKIPALIGLIRKKPTGNKCIECGKCDMTCPMDVNISEYIKNGKSINSTECILCNVCVEICPVKAIR